MLYFVEHRGRIYQQLIFIIAITDIVKSGSWLIGTKYDEKYNHCATQEYLFQFGALAQALTTVLICGIAVYTVIRRNVPSKHRVLYSVLLLSVILVGLISASIINRTATLFCLNENETIYEKGENGQQEIITYLITFGVSIHLCIIFDIICYIIIFDRIEMLAQNNHTGQRLWMLVTRLKAYPIIFVMCYVVNTALFIQVLIDGHFYDPLIYPAAALVASTGSFIALNYFYYQRKIAPLLWFFFKYLRPKPSELTSNLLADSEQPATNWSDQSDYRSAVTASSGLSTVPMTSTVASFVSEAELPERISDRTQPRFNSINSIEPISRIIPKQQSTGLPPASGMRNISDAERSTSGIFSRLSRVISGIGQSHTDNSNSWEVLGAPLRLTIMAREKALQAEIDYITT